MKTTVFTLLTAILIFQLSCERIEQKDNTYETIKAGFLNPEASAKPKVYWWCLNGNIDTVRAKQELLAMKEAGIGGFDLFEIGVQEQDTMIPGGPAFLSDESLEIIKYVVTEAGKLDLSVGLNLASSWNAGGSWIEPKHGGKSLYFSETFIKGHSEVQRINVPFPLVSFPKESLIGGTAKPMVPFRENGKPVYYEEVAVLAIPENIEIKALDTTQIINVTGFFDSEKDELNWDAPSGEWKIFRYICSNSGQQLVLPSPLSAGLTVDHFDSAAVRTHLMHIINRLKPVLGDFRDTALKSFYLASYEARGFVWTSTLALKFKQVNGYDISKFIPSLFDPELFSAETTKKVQTDFKKTLSELIINNLYKNAKELCNKYGLKINCEAGGPGYPLYNGPAEPLKALGALDIPRGEFWINHSRYYQDNTKDSIDILRVVKEVAAASHIYEKGIVEQEAFTSFQTFQYHIKSDSSDNQKIYIDLGNLSKVGEVWLNDRHVGITWSKPYKLDVTNIIKPGENNLTIEVSNTWSNRLTGDAITGKNYTNTNILKTVIAKKGILPGDQTRVPWAEVPLIESGLLGPVSINTIQVSN